jgi:hypothetical protein
VPIAATCHFALIESMTPWPGQIAGGRGLAIRAPEGVVSDERYAANCAPDLEDFCRASKTRRRCS